MYSDNKIVDKEVNEKLEDNVLVINKSNKSKKALYNYLNSNINKIINERGICPMNKQRVLIATKTEFTTFAVYHFLSELSGFRRFYV